MNDASGYHTNQGPSRGHSASPVSVVLVHFGPPEITWRCVMSLLSCEQADIAIWIVDHDPASGLAGARPEATQSANVTILPASNGGFARGCNLAATKAFEGGSRYVCFLNNDAILSSSILGELIRLAEAYPSVGLWGTHQRDGRCVIGPDRLPKWFPTPARLAPPVEDLPEGCRQLQARETLSGASILVTFNAWKRLGPWPEWCFLYFEDTAWCLTAHDMQIPIVMTSLEIQHERNTTTGRHSRTTTYYGVRNSLLLHADRWPGRKWRRVFQSMHFLQKRFIQGRWRMLGPTALGILDAWRGLRGMRSLH